MRLKLNPKLVFAAPFLWSCGMVCVRAGFPLGFASWDSHHGWGWIQ